MMLYVHVPFCRKKCRYCAFYSKVFDMNDLEIYLQALSREMAFWKKLYGKRPISSVFIGGGTPSLLPEWALPRLIPELRRHFLIQKNAEFTFECNPDSSLDVGYLRNLRSLGVNRLSIGVQTLNNERLRLLGRPHDGQTALAAVSAARRAEFRNISLDLMWGIPGQRLRLWLEELKNVLELAPEHLSCYGLTLEPETPLAEDVQSGKLTLPDEDEQAKMFLYGARLLEERGYLQYEISNFAKIGFQCRHNLGYWQGKDYLGLGPSAVSTIDGKRFEHPADLRAYAKAALAGTLGEHAVSLTMEDRIREMIMLSLRTSSGLDLKRFRKETGRDFFAEHKALLTALRQNDLIRLHPGRVCLTRNGMIVSNVILERLMYPQKDSLSDAAPTTPQKMEPSD
nr:radical SAM family heme chaperone HemW [Desulfovibrio inopinatus]